VLTSIVIDNFNYAAFLPDAVDSALRQTHPRCEVIVVDDGSTDGSREVLARYGERVRTVLQPNGGQASALNTGFRASRGEVVLFLDSDDTLVPDAVATVLPLLRGDVVKVHWPMRVVDARGEATGRLMPPGPLPQGDHRDAVLRGGPTSSRSSPTSGNAWSRDYLAKVMPIPEDVAYYRKCADEYLFTLAPVFGGIARAERPLGTYRVHERNTYSSLSFDEKLRLELAGYDDQCAALRRTLARHGVEVDLRSWRHHSWFHRLDRALADLALLLPDRGTFILVDDETWGAREIFGPSRVLPFLERDGEYAGPPPDDEVAIRELERLRAAGATRFVLAWPAFWWIDHYRGLLDHLRSRYRCMHQDERLVVHDLGPGGRGAALR
jgi:glycosyltransferase involved in cell wall biosynthesis